MTDTDALKKIFFANKPVTYTGGNKYSIEFEEGVKIEELTKDAVIVNIEKSNAPKKIFDCSKNKGLCKLADYVVIDKDCIIVIEIKDGNSSSIRDIKRQLRGAESLMKYCIESACSFYQINSISTYSYRFIAIINTKLGRRRTRHASQAKGGDGKTIENMRKFSGNKLFSLNQLIE